MKLLQPGDVAPDFSATDQNGKTHSLADYRGGYVLLYFYPKDNTPGCTTEACTFRDIYNDLKKHVTILGVSADSESSHKKFTDNFHLPFTLLSDPDKKIIGDYGADGVFLPKRVSFLIGPEGKIVKFYEKVVPADHPAKVLADLEELGG